MADLPAAAWAELEAFDAVEPIGGLHAEILLGQIAGLIAQANFKRAKPFGPEDFMPFQPPREPEAADLAVRLRAALDAHNARRQR